MKKFTALLRMPKPVQTSYGAHVTLGAVYDPNNSEHQKWAQATPSMQVNANMIPEFAENLEPGQYLVTFERVGD